MTDFNPNNPGIPGNIFGLPYSVEQADIVILPIPWDVTVSYGSGTSRGPAAILNASTQIDYSIPKVHKPWELKVAMEIVSDEVLQKSNLLRSDAERYIQWIEQAGDEHQDIRHRINLACSELERDVRKKIDYYLERDILVGCLGGDHSTPLGLINALANRYDSFGILQIDAHMDLRDAYEGLEYSHASIMFNALTNSNISHLIQVGIRDYCEEEVEYIRNSNCKVITFYDQDLKEASFNGSTWQNQVKKILSELPDLIYISFDIDGLNPSLCPNTGTPVPGGLSFQEATYLIQMLVKSGKKIIGFDLSEVSPGEGDWDANVGARILYQLAVYAGISQGKLKFEK